MNKQLIFILLFFFGAISATSAQAPEWGDQPTLAQEAYARLVDYVNAEQYKKAYPDAAWLTANAPKVGKDMYIKAIDVYEEMEDAATDKKLQQGYQDTILLLYKRRIKYNFGNADDMYRRAGYKAYPYLVKRGGQEDTLFTFYTRVIELNEVETPRSQLTYYMDVSGRMWRKNKITKEELFEVYNRVQGLAVKNIKRYQEEGDEKNANTWKTRCAEKLDEILVAYLKDELDCQTVKDVFVAKAKAEPENQEALNKAIGWMKEAKCMGDQEFLNLLVNKYEKDKNCDIGKSVAKLYMANKDYTKAVEWYEKVYAEACSPEEAADQGEVFLQIGRIKYSEGGYSEARNYAQKAAAADESVASEAYTFIGDMYAGSFKACGEEAAVKASPIKRRGVFMAAYDMYSRAGNSEKMAKMKEQFPTKGQVFSDTSINEGDMLRVGCWIQTNTTVRVR